jgi:Tol biopolymer transport system component
MTMKSLKALTLLALLLTIYACKSHSGARPGNLKLICHIDAATTVGEPIASPDSRHVAYVSKSGSKRLVVVDGQPQKLYDFIEVPTLAFSPNSQRLAYVAWSGKKQIAVVDGVEGKPYDGIENLIFSPSNLRVAYVARIGGKSAVVVDGKEEQAYDLVSEPSLAFSPDNTRLAYFARANELWRAVIDGKEQKPYDDAHGLAFSPDSKHVAYVANIDGNAVLLVDGKKAGSYDEISNPAAGDTRVTYSPDGQRLVYGSETGDKWTLQGSGKPETPYEAIGSIAFSPNSQQIAYEAQLAGKWIVVADGKEGKPYDSIGRLLFSPDGRRLAYLATASEKQLLVVDGDEGKPYAAIVDAESLQRSPACSSGPCWLAFYPQKPFTFSPDGKRVAYQAKVREKRVDSGELWAIVVDGKEQSSYEGIGGLVFSPDSQHVAYVAGTEPKQFVVVDGKEGKQYDGLVKGATCLFDSPSQLHYLAKKTTSSDGKSYDIDLVEETIR